MNLHPYINGCVGLWQFQSDLKDSSGNGLDLTTVNNATNAPAAAQPFNAVADKTSGVVTNDPCLLGIDLDMGASTTKLMAPLTPLLQLVGPMTIEWVMVQKYTFDWTYFCCANPAGRTGGQSAFLLGNLFTMPTSSGNPYICDQFIDGTHPSGGYDAFPGYSDHILFNWGDVGRPNNGDYHPHHFAYTFDGTTWRTYRDGITTGVGVAAAGTNVAQGNEQFFIGGYEKMHPGEGCDGHFTSVRILNYARAAADVLADANLVNAVCGGGGAAGPNGGTSNAGGGNIATASATGLVYDAVAAAQFGIALRQAPRT